MLVKRLSISAAKILIILNLTVWPTSKPAIAKVVVSLDRDFRVSRDFGPIKLTGSDRQSARVFFEGIKKAPPKDDAVLNQMAADVLASKVSLIAAKSEANYSIIMIMSESVNYAIKNPEGAAARGFVLIGICRLPLSDTTKDCQNLTYHYFKNYEISALMRTVLSRWVKTVFPEN